MIESLLAVMTSSGFGAVTGGFFGWLNRREDRKTREADQVHEEKMIGLRANAEEQVSEARAFEESQKTLSKFADSVKAVARPIITAVLLWMTYQILKELQGSFDMLDVFPPKEAMELYKAIVLNIICLASTAVSWWFASRPTGISLKK